MAAYTDKAAVENYLLTTIAASFDAQLTEWITAMSNFIDNQTGRIFIADTVATARLFEGVNHQKLLIDDCVAVTLVEVGDTYGDSFNTITAADYVLLPFNSVPKNCVALKRQTWGVGIHRITAKWGYSVACPADIKLVATVLTAGIVNTQVKTGTAKKSETIGNYTVSYHDDHGVADFERALALLEGYRRITI